MYFVHPQIKLKNLFKAKLSLIKSVDSEKLNQKLSFYFPGKQFVFTDMGRSAFKIIIEKLDLRNSEILMPAYICDIFYPILKKYNIKPVFLDVDLKTFSISSTEIERKISPQIKTVLLCHTYGLPANVKKNGLTIIEDCAHSFLAKGVGNNDNISFFSLYKQFPTLRGGLLVCPKEWNVSLPKTSFNFRDLISFLNCFSLFAFLFKKFGGKVAPKIVRREKLPEPAAINRVSLSLFSDFFDDFEKSLENRKRLALFFQEELKNLGFLVQESQNNVFCYLSALVPERFVEKRDKIVEGLRKYKVFCTRIWHTPIILNKEAQKEYQINLNEFPHTIIVAKRIINFPLQGYYTEKDIRKIIQAIEKTIKKI
ncbi:MAG: DegT/DnrJ/EryC1/StrS family aminotransferase [Candidatus Nealsonbacteria bacterium]